MARALGALVDDDDDDDDEGGGGGCVEGAGGCYLQQL
jgi:hypothetical protein